MKYKTGMIFRNAELDNGHIVWHEIMNVSGDLVTVSTYGASHGLDWPDSVFRSKELDYCFRKGLVVREPGRNDGW